MDGADAEDPGEESPDELDAAEAAQAEVESKAAAVNTVFAGLVSAGFLRANLDAHRKAVAAAEVHAEGVPKGRVRLPAASRAKQIAASAAAARSAPEPEGDVASPASPVLATGPMILGRSEPLQPTRLSPAVQQARDVIASIVGSLRGGAFGPESGLHWAGALLVGEAETVMAVATSDAGWLPPGVVIPDGVRVLWNVPAGYRWSSIDDPVRQIIEYAGQNGYTIAGVATTHPSRAYGTVIGTENIVGVTRPGTVLPGGRSRLEATVSPARLQHIRSLTPEEADRQARALLRDLEQQFIAPEHAIGIEAARLDARCHLDAHGEVPPPVLDQLHRDEQALGDVLSLDRIPATPEDLASGEPEAEKLRDRLLERAILVATLAASYHDIESAVYAWTYARFLSSRARVAPNR